MTSDADAPSRTARKRHSEELQGLGEQLVELRPDLFASLDLPDALREAIVEAKRLTSFGAKRRQAQFVGKLMRHLADETLDAVRAALRAQRGPSAKEAQLLHRAEVWRDALIADDERLAQWTQEFPSADAERLRALIRAARAEAREGKPGAAPRKGSAYRQVFTIVRAQLGRR